MPDWLFDLRQAVRGLRTQSAFAIISIAVLALGIGANTAMFGTLHAALLQPLPYAEPARIIVGQCAFYGQINPNCSSPDYLDYRDQATSLVSLSIISTFTLKGSVTGRGEPERITFAYVSHDLFRTLGVSPIVGRQFTEEEGRSGGPDAVLVTHAPDSGGRAAACDLRRTGAAPAVRPRAARDHLRHPRGDPCRAREPAAPAQSRQQRGGLGR